MMIIFFYPNDGRKLKQIIIGLLKSGAATTIKRINYLKSYTLDKEKIQKQEEKMVIIEFFLENKIKIENMLKKFNINNYKYLPSSSKKNPF